MRLPSLSVAVAIFIALPALAQRQYTSDELIVLLRTGPSTENAIIRNMTPGTLLEVLQEDAGNGYSRVRLVNGGLEGFVLSQYLTPTPVARDRLVLAERNLETARERVAALEEQVRELEAELGTTRNTLESAQSTNSEISTELEDVRTASANAIALRDQNETLRRRVSELNVQADTMAMENAELASRSRQNWFVVGAAVLLGGIIIGLVAPTLRRKRRSSW
jgi:SH3 domain protein